MLPNPKHIQVWPCWLAIGGLISLDWISKTLVRATLFPESSLPVLGHFLKITYVQNYRGVSWWVPELPLWSRFIMFALFILVIFAAYPTYLFYVNTRRHTIWADIAFVLILASCSGHLLNDLLMPFTVDFIQVDGSPSANFADLYGYLGIFALAIEAAPVYRHPTRLWKGFRAWFARRKALRNEFLEYYRKKK
jgi:lipoprotein signal peptidase